MSVCVCVCAYVRACVRACMLGYMQYQVCIYSIMFRRICVIVRGPSCHSHDCCVGACYRSCVFITFRGTCVIVLVPASHGGNSRVLFVGVRVLKACSLQSAILYYHSCQ